MSTSSPTLDILACAPSRKPSLMEQLINGAHLPGFEHSMVFDEAGPMTDESFEKLLKRADRSSKRDHLEMEQLICSSLRPLNGADAQLVEACRIARLASERRARRCDQQSTVERDAAMLIRQRALQESES